MNNENIIICPQCGTEIDVNEVLYHQLEEEIKKEYEKKLSKKEKEFNTKLKEIEMERLKLEEERKTLNERVEKEVQDKLKAEKNRIEKLLRKQIEDETSEQIKTLQEELNKKSQQVKELNRAKAEIEKLKREKEELADKIIFEKEKEFSEKLFKEKIQIRKQVEEEIHLKIQEKEKIIEDLKNQLEEAKRKAEQTSSQLQGEIQELEIEKMLKKLYERDEIIEIKKGQKGADILQIVKTIEGIECGKIYYESKRTKNFNNEWIQKLKDDNLHVKADLLVIVTETMPEGMDRFGNKDGVWICSFYELKGLSMVLRHMLIKVNEVMTIHQNKSSKMELLYNYLTSQEFRAQFEAIIDGFTELQKSYMDEKLKMQKIWKEREKQLERILTNAIAFYGSLRGIAGTSIPKIKTLEFEKSRMITET
ncbi:MAG: DUF2130 domain-containing protein [Thermodesulfovibrio sp.]|nr:DUF2130 domain-containing protein [Thermodesulfovibrio sp.]MDW7999058.1 DUF2130 domain-containing protein [Thermodesulfovibrio sp.]